MATAESKLQSAGTSLAARLRRIPLLLTALVMALVLVSLAAYGATRHAPAGANPIIPEPTLPEASPAPSMTPATPQPNLEVEIARLQASSSVEFGVAISPLHLAGNPSIAPLHYGDVMTGPAWATAQVPVSLAVLDQPKRPRDLGKLLSDALVHSSHAAGDALWSYLGPPSDAAVAATAVLRRAGDARTTFPGESEQISPYRETIWRLDDQANFAGTLGCTWDAYPVVSRMGISDPTKFWGLGTLPVANFRGDWGAEADGRVLARQLGLVQLADGTQVGVALAVRAETDVQAKAAMNDLARVVYRAASGVGTGQC